MASPITTPNGTNATTKTNMMTLGSLTNTPVPLMVPPPYQSPIPVQSLQPVPTTPIGNEMYVKAPPFADQWGHLPSSAPNASPMLSQQQPLAPVSLPVQPSITSANSCTDLDDALLDDASLDVLVSKLARETAAQFVHGAISTNSTGRGIVQGKDDDEESDESDHDMYDHDEDYDDDDHDMSRRTSTRPITPENNVVSDFSAAGCSISGESVTATTNNSKRPISNTKTKTTKPPRPTSEPRRRPKTKRIRRPCSVPQCGKRSRSHRLCIAHGGGRRCAFAGCDKSSQGGDMCIKHGGGKRCRVDGCEKAAQTNLLCKGHGGGLRCQEEGCDRSSQGGGYCRSHGGGRRCTEPDCMKGTQRGAYCALHGGSRLCIIEGCRRNDRGGGYCAHHGGGKRCTVDACTRPSRRSGLCSTHLRALENGELSITSSETSSGTSTPLTSISLETKVEEGNVPV